ncbi:7071_t:CDS:1, partial [Entrophospora sp. SA101]
MNDLNVDDYDEENEADVNINDQESLLSTLLDAINEIKNW